MPSRLNRADYLALNTFVLVAERLSFREVAEMLDISPSAVSQQIMGLEDRLGVRLFTRTTRVVKLTDEGKSLYAQTSSLLQGLADSLAQAHARSQLIQGHLRIHAFRSAAEMLLDKKLADFLSVFPDVHLDLSINDAPTDLIAGGYDLSLRLGEVLAPGLVAVPAGGAPASNCRRGAFLPGKARDNHQTRGFGASQLYWLAMARYSVTRSLAIYL